MAKLPWETKEQYEKRMQPAPKPKGSPNSPATGGGITIKEAASRLSVHPSTVYRWIKAGKLSARRDYSQAGGRKKSWVNGGDIEDLRVKRGGKRLHSNAPASTYH